MNDPQEYIESYFEKQLSDDERSQFEARCIDDESFAREVAFYITTREGIRQKLLEEKKQRWAGNNSNIKRLAGTHSKLIIFRKWVPYMAAACLVIAVALYFFMSSETPHQLANKYVKTNLTDLSQTMDASKDSIQQGIAAYNEKDYSRALDIFKNIYQADPGNIKAKKYIGLVYLVTKDYDKAFQEFDELANKQGVYKNPGTFLKAVTLLQRNKPGDKSQARQLLEQVQNENTEGSREAGEWLKKW